MSKMNLLIADDDKTFCELLGAEMRSQGWGVTIAADAMQTIMYARRILPAVIVLDIQMPGGNGVTALRTLKASTKTADIPVLVVSGSTEAAMEATVLAAGAARYLAKPVDFTHVGAVIEELAQRPAA